MSDLVTDDSPEGTVIIDVPLRFSATFAAHVVKDDEVFNDVAQGLRDYLRGRLEGKIAPITFGEVTL